MRIPLFILLLLPSVVNADVQSETIFFLEPDGQHYLLQRSIHSESEKHSFHLNKTIKLSDIQHISPARFEWDDSKSEGNSLEFESGGFTIIYPDSFQTELKKNRDGSFTYKSWGGKKDSQSRYGYWYSPGNFTQFSYSWIFPENIELLRYRSNRSGQWSKRKGAINFYAERVNNLTFEISFRIRKPAKIEIQVACPEIKPKTVKIANKQNFSLKDCPKLKPAYLPKPSATTSNTPQAKSAFGKDSDSDQVVDDLDLCSDTPQGAKTDRAGCPLDTDKDNVFDGIDRCIATSEETAVDAFGCSLIDATIKP